MRAEEAFSTLTEERKRRAVRDVCALLRKEKKDGSLADPPNAVFIRSVLRGDRSHACSRDVAQAVSAWFVGVVGIDVQPEEVTGMRAPATVTDDGKRHDGRATA